MRIFPTVFALVWVGFLVVPKCAPADEGDLWMDFTIASYHTDREYEVDAEDDTQSQAMFRREVPRLKNAEPEDDGPEMRRYNEWNPGIGLSYEVTDWLEARAGVYKNSYSETSFHAGFNLKYNLAGGGWIVAPGIWVAGVTGYHDTPADAATIMPFALPNISIGHESGVRVVVGYLPPVDDDSTGLATLQAGFKFH